MNALLSRIVATRTGRRALAVLLWALFAGILVLRMVGGREAVLNVAAAAMILGMVGYTLLVRAVGILCTEGEPLDERQKAARDRAYFVAFRIGNWVMVAVLIYVILAERLLGLWVPRTPHEALAIVGVVAVAFGLLPATVLAWSIEDEPMEDEEAPPVRLLVRTPVAAWRRHMLFALALCAAAAAALGGTGAVPALAARTWVLAGMAMGMLGGLALTRTRTRHPV